MSPDSSYSSSTLTNGVSSGSTSLTLPNTSSSSSSSASGNNNVAGKKPADAGGGGGGGGMGAAPPRVDLEPIYEGLRAGLTLEQWLKYKEGLSGFLLGRINRQEFTTIIDPIITGSKQRLHNKLLMGIYTNASSREPPPHEIAPYVLATNRASTTLSRGLRGAAKDPNDSGDARVEARLKIEVMALAPRDRRRIKEISDSNPEEILPNLLRNYHQAKQIKIPDPDVPPQSATPNALNNKTNWEAEIKSRYNLPLACESGEFPDLDGIKMRMLPICYEEGVVGGVGEATAQFMNVAAEVFVKEILSSVISRVRCNRTTTIKTDGFKRKMEMMSEDHGNGGFGFGGSGLTLNLNGSINKSTHPNSSPSRKKKRQKLANGRPSHRYNTNNNQHKAPRELAGERKVLCMNDLRLSFTLGDGYLTQLPLSLNRIMAGGWERPEDYYVGAEYSGMPPPPPPPSLPISTREGRNQPNFARPRGGARDTGGEKHGNMLNALVSAVSPAHPSPTSPSKAEVMPPPPVPPVQNQLDELLWNDGFEPWGPDYAGLGVVENGSEWVNPIDVNEIINGWEFQPPPPVLPPGHGGEWYGAGVEERRELRGLLDDCLAVGV